MTIHMKNLERLSLAEMEEFVQGNRKMVLSLEGQPAIYGFIEALLKAQQYGRLSRGQRGVVRRFLIKVSGFEPDLSMILCKRFSAANWLIVCPRRSVRALNVISVSSRRFLLSFPPLPALAGSDRQSSHPAASPAVAATR